MMESHFFYREELIEENISIWTFTNLRINLKSAGTFPILMFSLRAQITINPERSWITVVIFFFVTQKEQLTVTTQCNLRQQKPSISGKETIISWNTEKLSVFVINKVSMGEKCVFVKGLGEFSKIDSGRQKVIANDSISGNNKEKPLNSNKKREIRPKNPQNS